MLSWRKIIESRSQSFFCCLISFIAGVALGNFFVLPHFLLFIVLLVLIFALIILVVNNLVVNKKVFSCSGFYVPCFYVLMFSCFLVFGFWRYQAALPNYSDPVKIYHYISNQVEFVGRVDKAESGSSYQNLVVKTEYLIDSQKSLAITGKVQLIASLYPEYRPGDEVKVSCRLNDPKTDSQTNKSYANYLFKDDIFATCDFAEVSRLKTAQPSIQLFFYELKRRLALAINSSTSEPAAALLSGTLLNDTKNIPKDLNQIFSDLSLTHIIAISGSHIVILISIIMALLLALGIGRLKSFWPAAVMIMFYILLIGAPASAVRSALMALVVLYAQKIGRLANSKNALLLAASVMILINPKILLFDVGFQLSFMAVIGLMYVSPILQKQAGRLPELGPLKEIFLTTLSAQLMTLPLLMFYFSKLSLISLLANLLILPIIPLLMTWGLGQMIMAALFLPLGQIMGWVSWLLVAYWVNVARLLHQVPYGYLSIPGFSWVWLVLFYVVIYLGLRRFHRRTHLL